MLRRHACPTAAGYQANYEGGNVDLRVPYIGYAAESIAYRAAGVDAYNALQAHVEKRMSHGIQVGSRTPGRTRWTSRAAWASSTTETTRSICAAATASRTYDRTHVIDVQLHLPDPGNCQHALRGRETGERMVARGHDRVAEWPALQRHRFLWRHRQHLLFDLGRHHQPVVPLANGCTAKNGAERALRRLDTCAGPSGQH